MDVGIVAQRDNERAVALADRLRERLVGEDVAVAVDESTASALGAGATADEADPDVPAGARAADDGVPVVAAADLEACDLVVSIGGDGTFLYAARGAGSTPVMGINLGEVGFLNAVAPADAEDAVLAAVERARSAGDPTTATLPRVAASGADWTLAPAANEVLVHGPRRGHGGGGTITVAVGGDTYASGLADGVIVATPTGSTAYNLSEDGPIVHPGVDALVLTTMAGADAMPPLVLDDDSTVTVTLEDAPRGVAVSDGRVRQPLDLPTTVTVERADAPLRVAGPPRDFFGALDKLR